MSRDHSEMRLLLDDYVGGALPDESAREVELHLLRCAECAEEIEETRALLAAARSLPREIAPPRDLWAGIQARIDDHPQSADAKVVALRLHRPRRRLRWEGWMTRAAAAVALVVLSSGATAYWLTRQGAGARVAVVAPTRSAPPAAEPTVRPAAATPLPSTAPEGETSPPVRTVARREEQAAPAASSATPRPVAALAAFRQTEGTVETLRSEYERRRSTLAPETVAIIEKNLEIVDRAIGEARAALAADPSNPDLPLMLSGIYRQKAELLQSAVSLQSRS